ncbi:MAG: glycosyltransferase [Clostridia bacterium]|nr:glycosyltransferase [Clostridia bacterium]
MISVCIATYNGEKFIEKQLQSILDQTITVDEVIICDDCSTDNTPQIVKAFVDRNSLNERWGFFVNEKNLGYCLNFYSAIAKAKGDLIFLCDQDDIWSKDKVEVMCDYMMTHTDTLVLASRYQLIDKDDNRITNLKIPYYSLLNDGSVEDISVNSLIGCSWVRGFSICFRSKIKEFLVPIDVKSILAHDWYICCLGTTLGKATILNRVLCYYRFHEDNVSLSDINRKEFLGSREKRVSGVAESINAHSYIATLCKKEKHTILRFVEFEKKRLKFLNTKNPFVWLSLVFSLTHYKRYYKSVKGAFRVWLGDLFYGYNINF